MDRGKQEGVSRDLKQDSNKTSKLDFDLKYFISFEDIIVFV
jgi:hypothetical protein